MQTKEITSQQGTDWANSLDFLKLANDIIAAVGKGKITSSKTTESLYITFKGGFRVSIRSHAAYANRSASNVYVDFSSDYRLVISEGISKKKSSSSETIETITMVYLSYINLIKSGAPYYTMLNRILDAIKEIKAEFDAEAAESEKMPKSKVCFIGTFIHPDGNEYKFVTSNHTKKELLGKLSNLIGKDEAAKCFVYDVNKNRKTMDKKFAEFKKQHNIPFFTKLHNIQVN